MRLPIRDNFLFSDHAKTFLLLLLITAFFFRTFFGHGPIFYEMIEDFYVISDKMSEEYLAALLRIHSLKKKLFRKTR